MSNQTKPTNLKIHDFPIESFIGGCYMPDKVCDDLIDFFESNPDRQYAGKVNKNPNQEKGEGRISQSENEVKKSIDIGLLPMEDKNDMIILQDYFYYLNQCISEYEFIYPQVKELAHYGTVEGLNIQKYEPGDGFYEWHQERNGQSTMTRCFVHMTYLNDVKDGGTDFWFQKLTSPAKKGLTLIWPADWTHLHKGQISQTDTKYILTGWLNYRD